PLATTRSTPPSRNLPAAVEMRRAKAPPGPGFAPKTTREIPMPIRPRRVTLVGRITDRRAERSEDAHHVLGGPRQHAHARPTHGGDRRTHELRQSPRRRHAYRLRRRHGPTNARANALESHAAHGA